MACYRFYLSYQILDVIIFELKCSSKNLRSTITNLADRIYIEFQGKVICSCRDNESNFTKIIFDDDKEDCIPIEILSVSCCYHSMQLVLNNLYDEDEFFRTITRIL